jgi:hypothetical protein
MKAIFLRVLEELDDKEAALLAVIRDPVKALGLQRFVVDPASFSSVPGSPFAYWVSENLRRLFRDLPPFETHERTAKMGLTTNADFRFLRLWWEDPDCRRRGSPFTKGGPYSPFYSDVYLHIRWVGNGDELKAFSLTTPGTTHWSRNIRSPDYYLRPGLTWSLRTKSELSLRVMPGGCVFGHKGPAAFVANDNPEELLSLLSIGTSKAFRSLIEFQLAAADARRGGAAHSYEVGVLQRTPVPLVSDVTRAELARLARRAWLLRRTLDTAVQTSHAFVLPALLQVSGIDLHARADVWGKRVRAVDLELEAIQADIDERCFVLYGIDDLDRRAITVGFGMPDGSEVPDSEDVDGAIHAEEESDDLESVAGALSLAAELVSWAVGVSLGHFDIRSSITDRPRPAGPEPFDYLPTHSAGILGDESGSPLQVPPDGYPISLPLSGVLVDDIGHAHDLLSAMRAVFEVAFGAHAERWWNDVAATLDSTGHDLRSWVASGLFEHHLKRYSKSRRKAPIFWQLSVASGRFSVWLFSHRLNRDTFFLLQNEVVGPRLTHEERQLAILVTNAGSNPSAAERKAISTKESFVEELRAMLEEVKRVAPLWNPTFDDGVVLTMAPLWRLVPQHKPWQRELKAKWNELACGKHDWSNISMHLWPERVVPKCESDRSLAIAHGLENAFWVEGEDGKWKSRPSALKSVESLVVERSSPAVKAALNSLMQAPTAKSTTGMARRKGSR